ncbi:MAG: helix-turn-helix domain-containing protein [Deltaproteobacteria bacterium]
MSGSRYVTGHVGTRPGPEQTRARARSFAAQSAQELTQRKAAKVLQLSLRQVERLCKRYRTEGPASLASRRRDCASNHQLPVSLRASVLELVRGRLSGDVGQLDDRGPAGHAAAAGLDSARAEVSRHRKHRKHDTSARCASTGSSRSSRTH